MDNNIQTQSPPLPPYQSTLPISQNAKILRVVAITFAGLVSGIVTIATNKLTYVEYYGPGILFGIAIILYAVIYQKENLTWGKSIGLTAISAFAYNTAYSAAFFVTLFTPFGHSASSVGWGVTLEPTGFIAGGLVGAFILTSGIKFLLFKLSWVQIFFLTLLGAVLGFLGFAFSGSDPSFWPLFVIWQTGMALVLGVCLAFNS